MNPIFPLFLLATFTVFIFLLGLKVGMNYQAHRLVKAKIITIVKNKKGRMMRRYNE